MMRQAHFWWSLRTLREQRMLLAMFAALAIVLAWLLVVRPLDNALADVRARHARAVIDLAQAQAQAEQIVFLEKSAPPGRQGPLAAIVGQRAGEAGFATARVTPQGKRVGVAIDAARAPAVFGWIAGLERRDGLVVDRLTARTNSDATIAVDATLRARR